MSRRKMAVVEQDLTPLKIDSSYQRGLMPHHKFIAKTLNPDAVGTLVVGVRGPDEKYTIDGQQRIAALKLNGIFKWPCQLLSSSGPEYEAKIYQLLNGIRTRKGLNKYESFKAALAADDPIANSVKRCVEAAGLKIRLFSDVPQWPYISCVQTMYQNCIKENGEEQMTAALKLLLKCWDQEDDSMRDLFPNVFFRFIRRYGDLLSEETMIAAMRTISPQKIFLAAGNSLLSRHAAADELIMTAYNKKARGKTKLPLASAMMKKLRTKEEKELAKIEDKKQES